MLGSHYNCTYKAAPSTSQLLHNLNGRQEAIFWFSVSFLTFTLGFTVYHLWTLFKEIQPGTSTFKTKKMLFIQCTYLVYSAISFVSLISPRTSVLGQLVFSVYLSFALKELMVVIMRLLLMDNEVYELYGAVSLSQPPLACCFCCLCPSVKLSKNFFYFVKVGVFQAVFLRPLLCYFGAVIWLNGNSELGIESGYMSILDYIDAASLLIAMYCMSMLYNGTQEQSDPNELSTKYSCIQMVCLISGLQHAILGLLSKHQVIPCDPVFNSQLRASDIHSFLVLGEMPILLVLSSFRKRRRLCQKSNSIE